MILDRFVKDLYNDSKPAFSIKLGSYQLSPMSKAFDARPARIEKPYDKLGSFYEWLRNKGIKVAEKPFSYMQKHFGNYEGVQFGDNIYVAEDTPMSDGKTRKLSPIERLETAGHEFGHYVTEQLRNFGYSLGLTKEARERAAQKAAVNLFSEKGAFPYRPAYELAVRKL